MIGVLSFLLAQAQVPPIEARPLAPSLPRSRPQFEVSCQLRDLKSSKIHRVAFVQYGGVYTREPGALYGGRSPTLVRFLRDDTGIFGSGEMDMTSHQVTDLYSNGPYELVAKDGAGSLTLYKTTLDHASLESPIKIAVTARAGRRVRSASPDRSWEAFLLVGDCDVAWTPQATATSTSHDRVKS